MQWRAEFQGTSDLIEEIVKGATLNKNRVDQFKRGKYA